MDVGYVAVIEIEDRNLRGIISVEFQSHPVYFKIRLPPIKQSCISTQEQVWQGH